MTFQPHRRFLLFLRKTILPAAPFRAQDVPIEDNAGIPASGSSPHYKIRPAHLFSLNPKLMAATNRFGVIDLSKL